MIFENYLMRLKNLPLSDVDEDSFSSPNKSNQETEDETIPCLNVFKLKCFFL